MITEFWQQGMVFQIPLEKNMGFTYIKTILTHDFSDSNYVIVKPFKIIRNQPLEKLEHETFLRSFNSNKRFAYDLLLLDRPKVKGAPSWKFIGTTDLIDTERQIPTFKVCAKAMFDYQWAELKWRAVDDLKINETREISFSDSLNIGIWQHSS